MKVRWLGHSCIEISGRTHVLIDPDYRREPAPDLDYILITHGHEDHLGRVGELTSGIVLASPDVCHLAREQGVSAERLRAVKPGDVVDNIRVLPGYSAVGRLSELWARLWGRRHRLPGGTPLSFLVEDDLSLLHIGDAYRCSMVIAADILCLPWRQVPFGNERFQRRLIELTRSLAPRYVIPIHHDIPPWEADPEQLRGQVRGEVVVPIEWMEFKRYVSLGA
ncbi:MAG: MBL fold metallo-hydrolase [Anaerolineae bacterium]|nr:MBL fold metallo-hydrolase [Anaerolineae bacterium]